MEEYVDPDGDLKLVQYHRKGRDIIDIPFKPYCYVRNREKDDLGFVDAKTHKRVSKKEFDTFSDLTSIVYSKSKTYEADVTYVHRAMLDMDWKIDDVPKAWVDIEVDDSEGAPNSLEHEITAIGIIFDDGREVFLTTIGKEKYNEYDMLSDFMSLMENVGIIITYNGGEDVWEARSFDMPYLATRYGLVIEGMSESDKSLKFPFDKKMKHCAFMDIYQIYRHETARIGKSIAGGFSLENVCQKELGRGKIQHTEKFSEMSYEKMKKYNMRDVELLRDLDKKFAFTDLKIGIAQLCHVCLTAWRNNRKRKELSPLILADQLMIEYSKSKKMVWVTNDFNKMGSEVKGAMVLEPHIGLHKSIQNFDVKQMYPNIMIYERLSPDKDRMILPEILIKLKKMRVVLKKKYQETGATEDFIMQYNYKVLANLFYGAFGNPASRYYDGMIANAVTTKGRNLLQKIINLCEDNNFKVVYGDTDSVFVQVDKPKVKLLERLINRKIEPYEIESGEYYKSIIYTGDTTGGTKKRYAGLQEDGTMKIVGLESIKRDYCVLSRETQIWALERLLYGGDIHSIHKGLRELYKSMLKGVYDQYLVLTKGVKKLSEYQSETSTGRKTRGLPHVRALKMAYEKGFTNMFDISFVYTKQDVEPVYEDQPIPKNINYDHYFDRQIRGVVEPLVTAMQIQDGTYISGRIKHRKTINESLFDHMSS